MFFLRLIIATGLGTASLNSGTRGYFQGSLIKRERLAVALSSQVDEGEQLFAAGSERLFLHWSWVYGTSTEKLVRWVAVKTGFAVALKTGRISRSNLADWLVDEHPLVLEDEPVFSLCCIEAITGQNARVDLLYVYGDKVGIGTVHTLAPEPRLSARMDGLAPSRTLREKRVALVGVGSGGSMVAINLTAAGIGTLHLFDRDVLSVDNVFRHACDLRHIGRAKVLAVKAQIDAYDLPSTVITHEQDVVTDAGDLWATMTEVDLVVCATDNILSRRMVNYVAVRSGVPLVMACTFENASLGEIIRVRPGESSCYECTRSELSKAGALQLLPDAEESGSHIPYGRAPVIAEEAQATNQGSRADVEIVSALQSRVAISTLLIGEVEPLPTDYLTYGGRTITNLSGPFNFERPFSTNWVHLDRQEACSVCGDIGRPVDKESDRAYEEIMAGL